MQVKFFHPPASPFKYRAYKSTLTYDYDDFYRASYDIKAGSSTVLSTDYTFKSGTAANSTTTVVGSMTNASSGWSETTSYTYDDNGNIETVSVGGVRKAKYYYDGLNQLIREDNKWANKTISYTYDKGGNILSVKEYAYTTGSIDSLTPTKTNTYTYGASNWHDKLTYYNGNRITYDAIGNPLTYYNGLTFTWQDGRRLAGISGNGLTASYKYDADGIRTQKTVNGVTTNYVLEGDTVVKETNGTDTLWYYYDAAGSLVSFELNGTAYFYVKNMQGDIVAITNASGNKVVEYTYDSWGKLISTSGSLASTVGVKNPYRYRSYRYDTETGLYYLQSRYYNPEIKRFINADGYASTGQGISGNNMFAYCGNNPINRIDSAGQLWNEFLEFAKTVATEVGRAMGAMSPAYAACGGVALADGPLPFGDIIAAAGTAILTVAVVGYGTYQATQVAPPLSIPKVEEKEAVIPKQPQNGTTYYHVTTPDNAVKIKATGIMVGSKWESGHVYAWKNKPNKYAIRNSGAHFGMTISFKTNASFSMDTGISDPKVQRFGPVVSTAPGPIAVWDVKIVG